MKSIFHTVAKVVLSLIMIMPALAPLNLFPAPTRDLYTSDQAFVFIDALMGTGYIMPIMALVFLASLFFLWTKREALSALLIAPLTVNIVAFHAFLDGGLLTGGAIMGNILLVLNAYFLWEYRGHYRALLDARK